jgi:hypothetical protein
MARQEWEDAEQEEEGRWERELAAGPRSASSAALRIFARRREELQLAVELGRSGESATTVGVLDRQPTKGSTRSR